MKKTKQKNKTNKKNVFQIVALALISLVLLGAVIDVANDLVKEEDPTEDVLPDDEQSGENVTPGTDVEPGENVTPGTDVEPGVETLTFNINHAAYDSSGYTILTGTYTQITYVEGMTWAEWVDSEYNTIGASIDGGFVLITGGYLFIEDLETLGIFETMPSLSSSSVIGTERVMVKAPK